MAVPKALGVNKHVTFVNSNSFETYLVFGLDRLIWNFDELVSFLPTVFYQVFNVSYIDLFYFQRGSFWLH